MPVARMTYAFVSYVFIFSSMYAYEGVLLPIFSHALQKQYELTPDGNESFIQEIRSAQQFSSLIKESQGSLIIVKYIADNEHHTDEIKQWFQSIAERYQQVHCVVIDLSRQQDLALNLAQLCLTILSQKDKPGLTDITERSLSIKQILENIMQIINREYAAVEPFYLFFKGDALIIPQNFSHHKKTQADEIIKRYQSVKSCNKHTLCSDAFISDKTIAASFEDMIEYGKSTQLQRNRTKKSFVLRSRYAKKCCFN